MTRDPEQAAEIARVSSAIESHILAFWEGGLRQFHMADLLAFVGARHQAIAPDSPGRILRQLRQKRALNYKIVNRSQSLYEFIPVPREEPRTDLFEGLQA